MQIKHLQSGSILITTIKLNGRVLATSRFQIIDGQIDIALCHDRIAAQGRITITTFSQADIVTGCIIRVFQRRGNFPGHILFPGSRRTIVDFLQQDNIGIVILEDFNNTAGLKTAIEANCPVNVVCDNSEIQERKIRRQAEPIGGNFLARGGFKFTAI